MLHHGRACFPGELAAAEPSARTRSSLKFGYLGAGVTSDRELLILLSLQVEQAARLFSFPCGLCLVTLWSSSHGLGFC